MPRRYTSAQLREAFLDYFAKNGHKVVPSSSLVPADDPTLLFTNAGMVQFKKTFLGEESRDYQRAASSQACVRAGGKHNDLENVGYTARHHTFFEMLGNFSFGDYFKREAIQYCWEFLTTILQLPPEKLWVTVYKDDQEAAHIWLKEINIDPARFSRCDEKDNFWAMGDTGPCGPCTEVFYDHGENIPGGPPGSPEADGDRYIEIWNVVFMQYNRDTQGQLTPLPKPSVDTGMGLERIAAVMQGVHNNYEIDLFQGLIKAIAALSQQTAPSLTSMRVIADHIRSCSFLISDGVLPANEGRGYVLRRIIRRAIRHGSHLGLTEPFFHRLVKPLVTEMGSSYPRLKEQEAYIRQVLLEEEEQFAKTLAQGLKVFEQAVAQLSGTDIPGEIVFRLFDTYGFPADLTADIARERHLTVDMRGFEKAMAKQRSQSQAASQFGADYTKQIKTDIKSCFTGYEESQSNAVVLALFCEEKAVNTLKAGENGIVILDKTPFYAESGGQIGDRGILKNKTACFEVSDTQKQQEAVCHRGVLTSGSLKIGDKVTAIIDEKHRAAIRPNHSATHLLHAALRQTLGSQVQQKGSLVDALRLRFDFAYSKPLSKEELATIERLVNAKIRENFPVTTDLMSQEAAVKTGAMALFGEKYTEKVRVLSMGDFSKELCGGTHVAYTGEIGLFKIISESAVAAGIRRIEAVTAEGAFEWVLKNMAILENTAHNVKASIEECDKRVAQLVEELREKEKQVKQLSQKLAGQQSGDLANEAVKIGKSYLLIKTLTENVPSDLPHFMDELKQRLQSAVVLLAVVEKHQVRLFAGVTKDLSHHINAGHLIKRLVEELHGKGGGRADFAQGASTQVILLPKALFSIETQLKAALEPL
ncbi:MAG: alanine--tRNA ligase [Gammaproteobacteria bacterium]|jgi:alanyl-tRNA synthetase|nr:alanine--tRNA ligase [Gammaproteobacteria bacterium]